MVSGVGNTYDYNGNTYAKRSELEAFAGFTVASAASAILYKALPSFSNPFIKQMSKEHANNHLYADVFKKAVDLSGLKEKGLQIQHLSFAPEEINLPREEISHYDVKAGLNAFFAPESKVICLNTKKASISGFHELGHAMNNMSGKIGKVLQKLRKPGYGLAGLMATFALLSRPKPKDAPKNLEDRIQDHCAEIAMIGILPTVAEEALASYNGIKMAKKAGLANNLVKNLRKFYGKALLSYVGYAFVTGLSVYAISKIMELFTRPKKIS